MQLFQKIKYTISDLFFSMKEVFAASPLYFVADLSIRLADVAAYYFILYCSRGTLDALGGFLAQGAGAGEALRGVALWIAMGAAAALAAVFLGYLQDIARQGQQAVFEGYISLKMARKCMELDISYFDSPEYYDLIAKARDGKTRLGFIIYRVEIFFANAISCGAALAIAASAGGIGPSLLVLLLALPALFMRGRYYGKVYGYEDSARKYMRKMSYLAGLMLGRGTAKEIRFYGMGEFLAGKYRENCDAYEKGKRKVILTQGLVDSALSALPAAGVMLAMYFVVRGIAGGDGTVGDFVYFLGIYTALAEGFLALVDDLGKMGESGAAIRNYNKFLSAEPAVPCGGSRKPGQIREIRFDHVTFTYPGGGQPALRDVSFSLYPDKRNAIVGVNGAGKTTAVKLLMRFYDPDSGAVLVNGANIKEYDITALRRCFSAVFQDFVVYSMSIRDNIAFSDYARRGEDGRIMEAMEFAGIREGIMEKAGTLDTFLSRDFTDDGIELSGGQRQKVAVARCAFSSSQVLVMDEPAASLDPEAEASLMSKLHTLRKGVVMVSHRLSGMKDMDHIIVLKDGRVAEEGTHEGLMGEKKEYYGLFSLQASKYREEG